MIQPLGAVYWRRRDDMMLDSVTSSGKEPSRSLIDGSAPALRSSSTMSANSQAEATITKVNQRKERNNITMFTTTHNDKSV